MSRQAGAIARPPWTTDAVARALLCTRESLSNDFTLSCPGTYNEGEGPGQFLIGPQVNIVLSQCKALDIFLKILSLQQSYFHWPQL
jgi:hypothetical protein